ncbi:hypothetical protein NL463_28730, partial [Klebsiella pneumoniae]|nr:hypothetical protein [Klebsiella pneumoniae]
MVAELRSLGRSVVATREPG